MGKGDKTRTQILHHALRSASKVGLEGLTIGSLAADLGMSKSGLFAHFQSKEVLQVEVLKSGSELFKRRVIRAALKAKPGLSRLRALFDAWMQWAKSNELPGGCIFVNTSVELDDRPGPARDYLVKSQKDWIRTLERFTGEARDLGELVKSVDAEILSQEVWGIVLSFYFYHRLIKDRKAEQRARESFEALLERYAAKTPLRTA